MIRFVHRYFPLLVFWVLLLPYDLRAANLSVTSKGESYSVLRRYQAKNNTNLLHQNFPYNTNSTALSILLKSSSEYDHYVLSHTFPWNQSGWIDWQNSDSTQEKRFVLTPFLQSSYNNQSIRSTKIGPGVRVYGQVNENLVFFSEAWVYQETTDSNQFLHQFDPDEGETCATEQKGKVKQKDRTCARYTSYLLWNTSWAKFKVGRDNLHMGPGYFSSLMFTRNTPPYYLISMSIPFSSWLYIDNYVVKMVDSEHSIKKYAHVHRFEFKPRDDLSIAFQDMVIYHNRDIDFQYILPLTPLMFVEDNTGGRDNDALGIDVMYSGLPYASLWGELFVDDLLSPTSFLDDFWENRWAFLVGGQVVSPWRSLDADLVLEYSRVEPWTYLGRSPYTSFRHFNVPSASKLGPDAWTIDIQLSYRPLASLEWVEYWEISRKGTQDGAVLGNVHDNDLHGTTKTFLEGNIIAENHWSHYLKYKFRKYMSSTVGIKHNITTWRDYSYWFNVHLEW